MSGDIGFGGQGTQFDVTFTGGPADGLADSLVMMGVHEDPPFYTYQEIYKSLEPLGFGRRVMEELFTPAPTPITKVAVYEVNGEPSDYNGDDDIVPYKFMQIMSYKEYKLL